MATLGLNVSHPGSQAYYDSLFELFSDWMVEFVKVDCEGPQAEVTLQANAVRKLPLLSGTVKGSTKPRSVALSLSPGTFGSQVSDGQFLARTQAATMYRITTDFWGGMEAVFGGLEGGGGSISRASLHANASLIGANGTFPDLDMLAIGGIRCEGVATVDNPAPACKCNNCNGTGMAYTIMSLWAIARSPLLFGGTLPPDLPTLVRSPKLTVAFSHSSYILMTYRVFGRRCSPTKTSCTCTPTHATRLYSSTAK